MIDSLPSGFNAAIVGRRKFANRLDPNEPPKEKVVVRINSKTGPHYEKFDPDDTAAINAWATKFEPAE